MKKAILSLSLILIWTLPLCAQQPKLKQVDTVQIRQNQYAAGWVKSIEAPYGFLKMKLAAMEVKEDKPFEVKERSFNTFRNNMLTGYTDEDVLRLRMKDISFIRFSDNFLLRFAEGAPIRTNIMQCPTMVEKDGNVYAEGLIRLTNDEVKMLLGPQLYHFNYQPLKIRRSVGTGQMMAGAAGFFVGSICLGTPVFRFSQHFRMYDYKTWTAPVVLFSGAMAATGLFSSVMAGKDIKNIIQKHGSMEPTLNPSKARRTFWCGVAATGVGLGALAYGYYDYNKQYKERNRNTPYPTGSFLLMAGGAILANVGITLVVDGAARLKAIPAGAQMEISF